MVRFVVAACWIAVSLCACAEDALYTHGDLRTAEPTYVVLDHAAQIRGEPREQAASAWVMESVPTDEGQGGVPMRVLEDNGDWLLVRSVEESASERATTCTAATTAVSPHVVTFEGWVHESDLLPVLLERTGQRWPDGSWAVLQPGVPVVASGESSVDVEVNLTELRAVAPVRRVLTMPAGTAVGLRFQPGHEMPNVREDRVRVDLVRWQGEEFRPPFHVRFVEREGGVVLSGRCVELSVEVETPEPWRISCWGSSRYETSGSLIRAGATVRARDGAPIGRVGAAWFTTADVMSTEVGLHCLDVGAFASFSLRSRERRAVREVAERDAALLCFTSEDIRPDPLAGLLAVHGPATPEEARAVLAFTFPSHRVPGGDDDAITIREYVDVVSKLPQFSLEALLAMLSLQWSDRQAVTVWLDWYIVVAPKTTAHGDLDAARALRERVRGHDELAREEWRRARWGPG